MNQLQLVPAKQLKVNNIKKTLIRLISNANQTKMDLVNDLGLSNTTLSDCINNLCRLNIVKSTGLEESIGGRRPSTYSVNADYGCFIGLTLATGGVKGSLVDFSGKLIESFPSLKLETKSIIHLVYEMIDSIIDKYENKNILAIGISVIGTVAYSRGIILNSDALNWHNVHLKELIERKFSIPTYIDHKINNAALYESLLGNARNTTNFMLMCGPCHDKVSIYLDGQILRGENNLAGIISHMDINADQLKSIRKLLSLKSVLFAYADDENMLEPAQWLQQFKIESDYFSIAAAVAAEINWYESIYFIM